MPFSSDATFSGFQQSQVPEIDYEPDFFLETLPAAFRTENTIGSAIQAMRGTTIDDGPDDPDFDPYEFARLEDADSKSAMNGYADLQNRAQVDAYQARLDKERADRQTLAESGGYGFAAAMMAGVADPINLLPGGALFKSFKLGKSILKSGASVGTAGFFGMSAQEAFLHSTQLERTGVESAINITAGTIFAGLLGGGAGAVRHTLAKKAAKGSTAARQADDIIEQIDNDFNMAEGGSGGAAKVRDLDAAAHARIEKEVDQLILDGKIKDGDLNKEVARRVATELLQQEGMKTNWAVDAAMKIVGRQDPGLRSMQSPSIEMRALMPELAETSLTLARNSQGRATPLSAEGMMLDWKGNMYRALTAQDDFFVQYSKGHSKSLGDVVRIGIENTFSNTGKINRQQFNEAVGRAMIRGDDATDLISDGIPEDAVAFINKTAASWRKEIIDPMTKKAIELGMLPEGVSVDTAASYFMRMYDIDKLTRSPKHRSGFLETTKNFLIKRQRESVTRSEGFEGEAEAFRSEISNIRREISAVAKGVGGGTKKGTTVETTEAVNAAIDALEDRLAATIDAAAEKAGFTGKAEKASAAAFFKTLRKELSEEVEEAVGTAVEKEATKALDDLIASADETFDADLIPIIRDEIATAGEDVAADAALSALPAARQRALKEAFAKAGEAFEKSLKAQETRLNKLLSDPEAATAKALAEVRAKIVKTATKEAAKAVRAATKELREGLTKKRVEFAQRRQLHTRDVKDAQLLEGDFASIAEEILTRIVGSPAGRLPYDVAPQKLGGGGRASAGKAAPLHKRAFGIDDIDIEDILVMDAEQVMKAYVRTMSSDLAIIEKFGDLEMTKQLKVIEDDYNNLMRNVTDAKELDKLDRQRVRDMGDIVAVRDRLRNTHGLPDDPSSWTARVGRGLLQYNYITKLGGMTASAIPDIGRPVMVHGLMRVMGDGLLPLIAEFKTFSKLTKQIRDMGIADDMLMNSRLNSLADTLGDDFARGNRLERALAGSSNTFGMASLMAPWNTMHKQFAAAVTMRRMIRAIGEDVDGTISKKEAEWLRASLISRQDARNILEQIKIHGQQEGRMLLPNVLDWDEAAGNTARLFRSSLRRATDIIIVTPGAADRPLMASSSIPGRVIFQFKSFALAATSRIMMSGLQQADMAALNGMMLSVFLGMTASAFKMWDAGRGEEVKKWTMSKWVSEGVDRSGLTGILFDGNNILEKVTRGTAGFSAFTGQQQSSRYASRNWVGAALGPSFGTAITVGSTIGNVFAAAFGNDKLGPSDTRAAMRLIPYNNLILLRQGFRKAEEGINSTLGIR
jgi:hypothetical protein